MTQTPSRGDTRYDGYLFTPRGGFNGIAHDGETDGTHLRRHSHDEHYTFDGNGDEDGFVEEGSGRSNMRTHERPTFEKFCRRTLQFSKLPEGVTHSDIAGAVRGGLLLEIYLRMQDRIGSVSFLHAADAQEFFRHIRRHDLYIRDKRVCKPFMGPSYKLISIG